MSVVQRIFALGLALALVACGAARAETRVEGAKVTHGPFSLSPSLVEVDVAARAAFGFRETGVGTRDTNELFLRWESSRVKAPFDTRDKRSESTRSLSERGGIHIGFAGVDFDGTRGNPGTLRLGIFRDQRLTETLYGTSEIGYQTGTFGGHDGVTQNKGGLHSQVGVRYKTSHSLYGVAEYRFTPGRDSKGVPYVRFGYAF